MLAGTHCSEEAKDNMLKASKKYWASEEAIARREAISKASKGQIISLEHKAKLSKALKGRTFSQESKDKMSKARKGVEFSQEHRNNISKANKMRWASVGIDERREYMTKPTQAIKKMTISSIEEKVKQQLCDYGIKFIQQKRLCGGRFYLDFWLPEYQLVIECNGDYWHKLPKRVERDQRLEEYVLSKGKEILWLWEHEIRDEWFDITEKMLAI